MKQYWLLLIVLTMACGVFAAPFTNYPLDVKQPDGTVLHIFVSGDEFHNWLHDKDGYTIKQNAQGWYSWAEKQGNKVVGSNFKVGKTNPAALGLAKHINLTAAQVKAKHSFMDNTPPQYRDVRAPHFGEVNNLVIFIKFTDSPDFSHDLSYYDDVFNNDDEGYNSMHNYFQAVSYNQLDIETHFYPEAQNQVIVPYVDSHPRGYYEPLTDTNTIGYDENDDAQRTEREFSLLASAVAFVSTEIPADLDLDSDDDGNVDNVCFVVEGSPNGWATLLWPHRWSLYGVESYIGQARVMDFNLQLESFLDGSGASVLCHEMSHTLGCPDLYRYSDNTINPIGSWDLMSGNTNPPQSMGAWMKSKYLDWATPITISQSGTYTINSIWSTERNLYKIPSWRTGEYYLVEYRKPNGIYDSELPGTGLLVYRLLSSADGNAGGPPDELYIYRPGGTSTTTNGDINRAHFSCQTGRVFMDESTSPNGFLSNDMPGGLDISAISAAGADSMSFRVVIANMQVTYPHGGETLFGGTSQTVTWKSRNQTGNVKIEFSSDNGATWQTVVASTPNNGSYVWQALPVVDSNQCLVKVSNVVGTNNDVCNATFSIQSTIATPAPLFPGNNMQNAPTNPTFRWHSVAGATAYHLQVSTEASFNSYLINALDIADTTYAYGNLTPYTTYYWQVAAYANIGLSDFCPVQTFTTGNVSVLPAVPTLSAPANNATNQPRDALLVWNSANYAQHYHYQVATDPYFTHIVQQDTTVTGTQVRLQPLAANTHYYWRVRAGNPAGYSTFSNSRYFTTGTLVANDDSNVPRINNLTQNYPNPFTKSTSFGFSVKDTSIPVKLTVFNVKGQEIITLFEGKPAYDNTVQWDGRDRLGKHVAAGVYYYQLQGKGIRIRKKLILL